MRFFEPLPTFIPWLQSILAETKLPLVEIGCGDGDLMLELKAAGTPCIGVDPKYALFGIPVPDALMASILPWQAEEWKLLSEIPFLMLCCRPCHSGFVERVNAKRHPQSRLFYVGKEANLHLDLARQPTLLLPDPIGKAGEYVWEVRLPA